MTTRSECAPRRTSTVEPSRLRTSTSHVAPFSESRSTAFAWPPGTSLSAAALAASAPEPLAPPSPSSPPTALATPTPPRASASAALPAMIAFLELVMAGVLQRADESPMRWQEQDAFDSSPSLARRRQDARRRADPSRSPAGRAVAVAQLRHHRFELSGQPRHFRAQGLRTDPSRGRI